MPVDLPVEILLSILKFCPDKKSVIDASSASRRLKDVGQPLLFEEVILRRDKARRLSKLLAKSPHLGSYIKAVHIRSVLVGPWYDRDAKEDILKSEERVLWDIFQRVCVDRLRAFSLELGDFRDARFSIGQRDVLSRRLAGIVLKICASPSLKSLRLDYAPTTFLHNCNSSLKHLFLNYPRPLGPRIQLSPRPERESPIVLESLSIATESTWRRPQPSLAREAAGYLLDSANEIDLRHLKKLSLAIGASSSIFSTEIWGLDDARAFLERCQRSVEHIELKLARFTLLTNYNVNISMPLNECPNLRRVTVVGPMQPNSGLNMYEDPVAWTCDQLKGMAHGHPLGDVHIRLGCYWPALRAREDYTSWTHLSELLANQTHYPSLKSVSMAFSVTFDHDHPGDVLVAQRILSAMSALNERGLLHLELYA